MTNLKLRPHAWLAVWALLGCGEQRLVVGESTDSSAPDASVSVDASTADGDGALQLGDGGQLPLQVQIRAVTGGASGQLTLACGQTCLEVEAVVHGGTPPYSYRWHDGQTAARRSLCDLGSSHELTVTDSADSAGEFVDESESESARASVVLQGAACEDAGTEPPLPANCRRVGLFDTCSNLLSSSRVALDLNGEVLKAGRSYELRYSLESRGRGELLAYGASTRCSKGDLLYSLSFDNSALPVGQTGGITPKPICVTPSRDVSEVLFEEELDLLATEHIGYSGGLLCDGCQSP